MALTLNGIAQGYITDRITEQLKQAGLEHALVDMGEIRGLGMAPGNRPWRVGLAGDQTEAVSLLSLDVHNQAVSTSSGSGTALSRDGSVTHLFNPANGQARPLYRSVSVVAGNATIADALSTARFRALDLRVESKPDLTPVSDADTAVEREIRALLETLSEPSPVN